MITTPLEQLIHDAGEDWLIESFAPREEAVDHLTSLLGQVDAQAKQRWSGHGPRVDLDSLVQQKTRNPHKVRAFLQAMGATTNPDMLLMVWRILEGRAIKQLEMAYTLQQSFRLAVTLESDHGTGEEVYKSGNIDDAALLRHLGIMTLDGKPIFDGFYPL